MQASAVSVHAIFLNNTVHCTVRYGFTNYTVQIIIMTGIPINRCRIQW
jgi:hypothetical protein